MLPSICALKDTTGQDVCPRSNAAQGVGTCIQNDKIQTGPNALVACQDHLNPPCTEVINQYHYKCNQDMGVFGAATAGHVLSDFCPESCNVCAEEQEDGATRYCADNPHWTSATLGHTCNDYATNPTLQATCFNDDTYVACPVACGACGDCCASFGTDTELCYFQSKYGEGSEVTGVKYSDMITLSGSSPTAPGQPWSVRSTFGMITYEKGNFEPDPLVDGVWGLGRVSDQNNCNPSCGSMQPLDAFIATPGAHGFSDLFAICLNFGGISTLDIGVLEPTKHAGPMYYFDVISDTEYQINSPSALSVCTTTATCTATTVTAQQMASYTTVVDLASEGLELPAPLFTAWQIAFKQAITTFSGLDVATMIDNNCVGGISSGTLSADTSLNDLGLPTVKFDITDSSRQSRTIVLNPADYLIVIDNSLCINVLSRPVSSGDNYLIFGRPVMQAYYTVFDRDNTRVGLATTSGICKSGQSVCGQDEFTCQNGECIPQESVGDGNSDCTDASDEQAAGPPTPGYNPNSGGNGGSGRACPALDAPANGHVQTTPTAATYSCSANFEISGLITRQCLPTGVWSGTVPSCRASAAGSNGAGSSATCIEVPDGGGRICSTYLTYGYSCDQMVSIYPEIDCHCACQTGAPTSCNSQAILDGCRDPSVALDPAHFCDNICATSIISQWDNCANDPVVAPLMGQYRSVRNYCVSQSGGGGH